MELHPWNREQSRDWGYRAYLSFPPTFDDERFQTDPK